jgi:hypothetical protein
MGGGGRGGNRHLILRERLSEGTKAISVGKQPSHLGAVGLERVRSESVAMTTIRIGFRSAKGHSHRTPVRGIGLVGCDSNRPEGRACGRDPNLFDGQDDVTRLAGTGWTWDRYGGLQLERRRNRRRGIPGSDDFGRQVRSLCHGYSCRTPNPMNVTD